jgi:hypothetical protein
MGALARSRLALTLALVLLAGEGLLCGLVAWEAYLLRGFSLNGTRPDVGKAVQFAEVMALWGAAHLLVAVAAALSRGSGWRMAAGAVQLIDFVALAILAVYNPGGGTPGENAILLAIALVPLGGAAVTVAPLQRLVVCPRCGRRQTVRRECSQCGFLFPA